MNKFMIFAIAMLITVLNLPAFSAEKTEIETVSAENLKKMMDDKAHFILIDARKAEDYNKEHIVSAISLPATDVNSETLQKIAPEVTTKLVFYCQNLRCQASHIAASKALGAGYKYLYEFGAGIDGWKELGLPTVIETADDAKEK